LPAWDAVSVHAPLPLIILSYRGARSALHCHRSVGTGKPHSPASFLKAHDALDTALVLEALGDGCRLDRWNDQKEHEQLGIEGIVSGNQTINLNIDWQFKAKFNEEMGEHIVLGMAPHGNEIECSRGSEIIETLHAGAMFAFRVDRCFLCGPTGRTPMFGGHA
jgi:hypothetical protein